MLTIYIKDGCPYCAVVMKVVDELGLQPEHKNIAEVNHLQELIEHGGKRQVPYLIDPDHDVAMYESADIATYLTETYGGQAETETNTTSTE